MPKMNGIEATKTILNLAKEIINNQAVEKNPEV